MISGGEVSDKFFYCIKIKKTPLKKIILF